MYTKISTALIALLMVGACTKNENPTGTKPADYAETHEKLIQTNHSDSLQNNTVKSDSMMSNSATTPTAMPPQPKRSPNEQ